MVHASKAAVGAVSTRGRELTERSAPMAHAAIRLTIGQIVTPLIRPAIKSAVPPSSSQISFAFALCSDRSNLASC